MSESGLMVDPVTGQPEDPTSEKKDELDLEKQKYAKVFEDTNKLLADLAGEGGVIYKYTTELLADRINQLVQTDPRSLALLDVLSQVKRKINVGNLMAEHYARINVNKIATP
jgi:hypothetical protein